MTNKKVRRQSLIKLNLTKPEKNSQWVFDQTKLVPSYNFRKCISTLKKASSLAKLPETLINACNNCFKEQLIVQYLNNTINVAYSSTFYIAHPNFQILHLSAQFIAYIVTRLITRLVLVGCGQLSFLSNQIAGFFDQQCLWKESIDILVFFFTWS